MVRRSLCRRRRWRWRHACRAGPCAGRVSDEHSLRDLACEVLSFVRREASDDVRDRRFACTGHGDIGFGHAGERGSERPRRRTVRRGRRGTSRGAPQRRLGLVCGIPVRGSASASHIFSAPDLRQHLQHYVGTQSAAPCPPPIAPAAMRLRATMRPITMTPIRKTLRHMRADEPEAPAARFAGRRCRSYAVSHVGPIRIAAAKGDERRDRLPRRHSHPRVPATQHRPRDPMRASTRRRRPGSSAVRTTCVRGP